MTATAIGADEQGKETATPGHPHGSLAKMAVGAIGIVFGDIGTSPIYAFRETFSGHHTLRPDALHIYGVLSLIFWSMMIIVTIKYVSIIMRADNKGEGGSLALLALINRSTGNDKRKWTTGIVLLGVFATSLFYGDSMITPAISVLSAVEGLTTVSPLFEPFVIPAAIVILIGLFAIQARGTAKVGLLFGPVMLFYFGTIAVLGLIHIVDHPSVIWQMLNPWNSIAFFLAAPVPGFIAMGSVVLAVTGAEALYSDMGHFGRNPIRVSWIFFVMPCLLLNYMGQGAMLLAVDPAQAIETVKNPFFLLAPEMLRLPLVILATFATIIASQAVISGAFSVTQQAIQLGFIPRLHITHTSEHAAGQIYIPVINWALMIAVIMLVLNFRSSTNLAAAYGIAVTGAMLLDGMLIAVGAAGGVFHRRSALLRGQSVESARRRLVPAADRGDRLHHADHLVARAAADDHPHERTEPADRGVHQVRCGKRGAGVGDGGVYDQFDQRGASRAAPQPQAQQGAS